MNWDGGERRSPSIDMGRLMQAVDTLTDEVSKLRNDVSEIKDQMSRGKGLVTGLLLAAGGVGAGISAALHKWFGGQ